MSTPSSPSIPYYSNKIHSSQIWKFTVFFGVALLHLLMTMLRWPAVAAICCTNETCGEMHNKTVICLMPLLEYSSSQVLSVFTTSSLHGPSSPSTYFFFKFILLVHQKNKYFEEMMNSFICIPVFTFYLSFFWGFMDFSSIFLFSSFIIHLHSFTYYYHVLKQSCA